MKVSLINPRMFHQAYRFFPLGLGYLAGAMEKEGVPWNFYDLHNDWIDTKSAIETIKKDGAPDIFGLSGLLTSYQSIKELCEALKENFPDSKIVVGGKIAVVEPKILFENMKTDFIVEGEGEKALIQLVNELSNGHDFENVDGLAWRDEKGKVHSHGEAPVVKNLGDYRIPYEKFDMEGYVEKVNIQSPNVRSLNMLSSRGCPFSCTFCNFSTLRSPMRYYDDLENQLDYLVDNFQLSHVTFNDDIFTVNQKHVAKVANLMKERNLTFSVSSRIDFLKKETIEILEDSGCRYLCVGIESPSPTVAKIVDKKLNMSKLQQNMDLLQASRIVVNYGFIIGYYGETEETIKETRDFVIRNKILYSGFFANAFPKTKLYDMIKDRIPDEKDYLERLFTVDLSADYLVNMTDIPRKKLYRLRDELVVESALGAVNIPLPKLVRYPLKKLGRLYLSFMRNYGMKYAVFKNIFEFINMSIVKPLTKKKRPNFSHGEGAVSWWPFAG